MYSVIGLIMFGIVIYDAVTSNISPLWILVGGLIGLGAGYLVGQIFKIYWHEDSQKVMMGIDRLSILFILAYVLLRFGSNALLRQEFHGQELTIITYSLLAGLLIGRMVGILHKAGRVLESKRPH